MLKKLTFLSLSLILSLPIFGQTFSGSLPLPTQQQLRWQQYEHTMFVCLDPCTWQGRQYDDHSLPLSRINPERLNTDQWCETATLWGAKLILFVAKHIGGFCWWQTQTSNYGIKETPWKNGKGDVLAELAKSCKKYGLDLGIYVYPGDAQWGAGIGSGGTTKDPAKQEAYNKVYRQQLTEVLTRYGPMREVWFDGSCNIPVGDILEKYAADAVILQGKSANLRWVGNEDGYTPYPNWYTLKRGDLATGIATALYSDPNGDAYSPVEVDVPLLHKERWFWLPNDYQLFDMGKFMDIYYKSVGRGAVLLLNSTPDTTGLIPASHVGIYKKIGEEIKGRFAVPLKQTSGEGESLEIRFNKPVAINHVILQEELGKGQRVLDYIIEGYCDGKWLKLYEGSSVGNKKIDNFTTIELEKIRVRFVKFKATPQIKNFAVYNVRSEVPGNDTKEQISIIGNWQSDTYSKEWEEVSFNLTPYMKSIGQYDFCFLTLVREWKGKESGGLEFSDWRLEMYGRDAPEAIQPNKYVSGQTLNILHSRNEKEDLQPTDNGNALRLTHSQQTMNEFPVILRMKVRSKSAKSSGEMIRSSGDIIIKKLTY